MKLNGKEDTNLVHQHDQLYVLKCKPLIMDSSVKNLFPLNA